MIDFGKWGLDNRKLLSFLGLCSLVRGFLAIREHGKARRP